jgi:hypothetical protein
LTLPLVLGVPLAAWSGPVALVVAVVALAVVVFGSRRHPAAPEPVGSDEASRAALEARVAALEGRLPAALQHAALVRYDAFPGAGGQFSFSAALLDGSRRGLLLTAITGRNETRLYAKWVEDGRCRQALSPEEEAALARALDQTAGQGRA